jgi:hypothetical protein
MQQLAPARSLPTPIDRRDAVLGNLSEVEGMSLNALRAAVDWGFERSWRVPGDAATEISLPC